MGRSETTPAGVAAKTLVREFQKGYYTRQYGNRLFFSGSDKPVWFGAWVRLLRKYLPEQAHLLEVGCGEGHFLRRAQKVFGRVSGLDISAEGVAQARKAARGVEVRLADASHLPFPAGAFDAIVAFDLIEHLSEPNKFLAEAFRVLRTGGLLVLSTPNPDSFGHRFKKERWFGYRDSTHVSIQSPHEWFLRLKQAGFLPLKTGTDAWWDAPYLPFVPHKLQKIFFAGLANASFLISPIWPWQSGENFVGIFRKNG